MAERQKDPIELEDDTKEPMSLLIEHRLPWLIIGLLGGLFLTYVSSTFESLLSEHIGLAFFIPVIVYMASAVGTQTDTVYIRNLNKKRTHFSIYLVKEFALGIFLGAVFGTITGSVAYIVFESANLALSIGLSMAVTMAIAPIVALIVPTVLKRVHKDPAIGTGPFVTVVQDFLSLFIYFTIATAIIVR
jgi:magnesium transporter